MSRPLGRPRAVACPRQHGDQMADRDERRSTERKTADIERAETRVSLLEISGANAGRRTMSGPSSAF
jgi:hypothetical protein